MHIASLGADPLADYEELPWLEKNPDRTPLYFALMPQGVWAPGAAPITATPQTCPIGDPSDDPLIPGVCNTSALVGAAALLGILMAMNR